jgi:ABC-type sugar transport system ATPase subunit
VSLRVADSDDVEVLQTDLPVGIEMAELRKEFEGVGGKKVAVKDLSLKLCSDRVTSLLGHNGAGP